jgi:cytochrome c553
MRARNLLVAALIVGCDAAATPDSDRDFVQKLIEIRERMHARFTATNALRMAIAYGDLRRTHAEARLVADLDEPDVHPHWKPYVDNVRAAAHQITKSEDTVGAAKQLATLGWRCAQCHEAVPGTRTAFPKVPAPPADRKLAATMEGHQWATARMWEGLIGPSTDRWNEGAAALAKAPLTITAEGDISGHELGIADDVARARLLATRAPKAKAAYDRAEIYGQLLATCANCHHAIRDR